MQNELGSRFIIVLQRPEDPVNIAAVVRAMKNFGFGKLRLVQPVTFDRDELLRVAHRCDDVIDAITVHADLDDALAEAIFVVGTAAHSHAGCVMTSDVRGLAGQLLLRAGAGPIALLFGPEADGLDRAALERCHVVAILPTNPEYPALNLAQSVLLFLYEIAMSGQPESSRMLTARTSLRASQADLERLFQVVHEMLTAVDFFKRKPTAVMHRLRALAYRAELDQQETALLMAMARQVLRRTAQSDETASVCDS